MNNQKIKIDWTERMRKIKEQVNEKEKQELEQKNQLKTKFKILNKEFKKDYYKIKEINSQIDQLNIERYNIIKYKNIIITRKRKKGV